MDKIDAADLKPWLTAEEDKNCSSRCTDVKLVRNGMRCPRTSLRMKPPLDRRQTSITSDEFVKLTKKFFDSYKRADAMAILKRCVVMIFGKRAMYLRLPSQDETSLIHCIHEGDLHVGLCTDRDKAYCAKYKQGIHEHPPTFEEDIEWEQNPFQQGMEQLQLAGRPETYLGEVNTAMLRGCRISLCVRPQGFCVLRLRLMKRLGRQYHVPKLCLFPVLYEPATKTGNLQYPKRQRTAHTKGVCPPTA